MAGDYYLQRKVTLYSKLTDLIRGTTLHDEKSYCDYVVQLNLFYSVASEWSRF